MSWTSWTDELWDEYDEGDLEAFADEEKRQLLLEQELEYWRTNI